MALAENESGASAGLVDIRPTSSRDASQLECGAPLDVLPAPGFCPVCESDTMVKRATVWSTPIGVAPGTITIRNVPAYWCATCLRRSFEPGTVAALYGEAAKAARRLSDEEASKALQSEADRIANGIRAAREYIQK